MEVLEVILSVLSIPALVVLLVHLVRMCQEVARAEVEERQSMVVLLDKIAQRLDDEKTQQ